MNIEATPHRIRRPRVSVRALALLVVTSVLVVLCGSAQAAEETYVFDAKLSLTGNCTTSTADLVPDPSCPEEPPSGGFVRQSGVAVDLHGNRYVVSNGGALDGSQARIDVFSPSGEFVTEITDHAGAAAVAVDSVGNLYVARRSNSGPGALVRYMPLKYEPTTSEIEYADLPETIAGGPRFPVVNPANDHLFLNGGNAIIEYTSAAEGNSFVEEIASGFAPAPLANSTAIDFTAKRIYVAAPETEAAGDGKSSDTLIKIFDLEAPHARLGVIDGSTTPTGRITSIAGLTSVAVNEETGHVFVGDLSGGAKKPVYEFESDGTLVSTIEHSFQPPIAEYIQNAVDNGPFSPNRGYLFVSSGISVGHSYAFKPIPPPAPPAVEGLTVSAITDGEAILHGKVNPGNLQTAYRFEYVSEQRFEASGFEGALIAKAGTLKEGDEAIPVKGAVSGLEEGTAYRFRLVANNTEGESEADEAFATYTAPVVLDDCKNQALRIGPSGFLPDCRAYELVTPANTNGHPPYGQENFGQRFPSRLASPAGEAVAFQAAGGTIPDGDGTGSYAGDPYLATRSETGWRTESAGPNGAFAKTIEPGSSSADQRHSVWQAPGASSGPAAIDDEPTIYLRYPDNHSEVVGKGSLATEPQVNVKLVSENGAHTIFSTYGGEGRKVRQLEPDAAPEGTRTLYDRAADGTLHVISLLPDGTTPSVGQDAFFAGASLDGRGVAFKIENVLYFRRDNIETFEIGADLAFAGVAEGGGRLFYIDEDDLYAFDATAGSTIRFTATGDVTVVNISSDGSTAYFISPEALAVGANPLGDVPQDGAENLYVSREGGIGFVGTVTQRDVEGALLPIGVDGEGLGLWMDAQSSASWGTFPLDPSRTTPDGSVLLFESRAQLTEYDTEGSAQVYRYDSEADTLRCLSCNPTGIISGSASLQSFTADGRVFFVAWNRVENLRADGDRAFFESTEALVLDDVDGLRDVYEWEEEGVGGCDEADGCIHLISSGTSGRNDYLYAVSDSGNDVFFRTSDLLSSFDPDETPSIYDARVEGGFPPPQAPPGECLGESCQPVASAPDDPTPGSSTFRGAGNLSAKKAMSKRCSKGKRAVRRQGKVRCVGKRRAGRRNHVKHKRRGHDRSGSQRRSHR